MRITVEMAEELGLVSDAYYQRALKSIEGASILSPATGRAFERAFLYYRSIEWSKKAVDKDGLVEVTEAQIHGALRSRRVR